MLVESKINKQLFFVRKPKQRVEESNREVTDSLRELQETADFINRNN
jgi:hypothetical protein